LNLNPFKVLFRKCRYLDSSLRVSGYPEDFKTLEMEYPHLRGKRADCWGQSEVSWRLYIEEAMELIGDPTRGQRMKNKLRER
jgi:hypothetical protein